MDWLETVKQHHTDLFKEESHKHMEGIEWWEDDEDDAFHNNIKELWQYFYMIQWRNVFGWPYYLNLKGEDDKMEFIPMLFIIFTLNPGSMGFDLSSSVEWLKKYEKGGKGVRIVLHPFKYE